MCTDAQLAANRENAAFSTGPRTPEGRAISARNAHKHGCFAREPRFESTQDEQDFFDSLAGLLRSFQAEGDAEHRCVYEIARANWLEDKRDAEQVHFEIYLRNYFVANPDPDHPDKPAEIRLIEAHATDKTLKSLHRRAGHLRANLNRAIRLLHRLQRDRQLHPAATQPPPSAPQVPTAPPVSTTVTREADDSGDDWKSEPGIGFETYRQFEELKQIMDQALSEAANAQGARVSPPDEEENSRT